MAATPETMLQRHRWWITLVLLGLVILVTIAFTPMLISWMWGIPPEDAGSFGDQFGVANALISGFAFAGVIASLMMQQRELQQQQAELRLTTEALTRQTFEQSLSNLTSTLITVRDRISIQQSAIKLGNHVTRVDSAQGMYAFTEVRHALFELAHYSERDISVGGIEHEVQRNRLSISNTSNPDEVKQRCREVDAWYGNVYRRNLSAHFGHYFRLVYRIFAFIRYSKILANPDDTTAEREVRRDYGKVVRALLGNDELWILYYNCCSSYGERMRHLADYFDMFDNLPIDELISPTDRNLIGSSLAFAPDLPKPEEIWPQLAPRTS